MAVLAFLGAAGAQQPTWEPVRDLSTRSLQAMALDPQRGRVVLFGGLAQGSHTIGGSVYLDDTWEWDGASWRPCFPANRPSPRGGARMAYDPVRGTVILFGGRRTGLVLGDMWEWDGQDWRQLQPPVLPPARWYPAMATDQVRQRVVMYGGGSDPGGYLSLSDTWEWDGSSWRQLAPATSPGLRIWANMAFCGVTGRVTMFGGSDGLFLVPGFVWEWDGVDWTSRGAAIGARGAHGFSADPATGGILLFGGFGPAGRPETTETWLWDGATFQQLQPAHWPASRGDPVMVVDPAQQGVVMYSGWSGTATLFGDSSDPNDHGRSTWRFRNGDWSRVHEFVVPDYRPVVAAVHVAAHDHYLCLTGWSGPIPPQPEFGTWVVENGRFRELHPPTEPAYRGQYVGGLCYHEGVDRVVLFGGYDYGRIFDETWTWDGRTWTLLSPSTRPPPTSFPAMTYDPHRQKVVLVRHDMQIWEWDQSGWSQRAAQNTPAARTGFALGYDRARRRLVVWGGQIRSTLRYTDETWEFDGVAWQLQQPATRPPAHIVVDGLHYVPWLGGLALSFVTQDTWLWDGQDWRVVAVQRQLFDGFGPIRRVCAYDQGRQRLRAFGPTEGQRQTASCIWDLHLPALTTPQHHPRPGDRLTFDVELPSQARNLFFLGFSFATHPGIPLLPQPNGAPALVPLAPGALLAQSIAAGMGLFLDAQGRGRYVSPPLARNPALVGIRFHAAGVTLDPRSAWLGAISNPVYLDIVR